MPLTPLQEVSLAPVDPYTANGRPALVQTDSLNSIPRENDHLTKHLSLLAEKARKSKTEREKAMMIDKISRVIFPLSFTILNSIYWGYFVGWEYFLGLFQ